MRVAESGRQGSERPALATKGLQGGSFLQYDRPGIWRRFRRCIYQGGRDPSLVASQYQAEEPLKKKGRGREEGRGG